MALAEAVMLIEGEGEEVTEMVTVLDTAVAGLAQAALLVRVQVMISLLLSVLLVKVLPVTPMSFPLTCH